MALTYTSRLLECIKGDNRSVYRTLDKREVSALMLSDSAEWEAESSGNDVPDVNGNRQLFGSANTYYQEVKSMPCNIGQDSI